MNKRNLILALLLCCGLTATAQKEPAEPALVAANTGIHLTDAFSLPSAAPQPSGPDRRRGRSNNPFGSNILTISPVNLVVVNSYGLYGVGFTYERLIGNSKSIGLQLPVHYAFADGDWISDDETKFFYTSPGVQFHITGKRSRVDFAMGPSLVIGNLNRRYQRGYSGNNGYYNVVEQENTFTSGIMLDNNLNIRREHFVFGFHATFGTTWWNANYPNQFFLQLGMRFGGII